MFSRVLAAAFLAGLLGGDLASAQEPTAAPPPSSDRTTAGPGVLELLPDLGRIGAEVGIFVGPSWNPYGVGRGIAAGGFVDLPLTRVPGGKLSYEILLALSAGRSQPFVTTNAIAYVANLATGASPQAALAGPPAAPFPVRREVTTRLRLFQISPFSLKYQIQKLDHARLRPYFGLGLDFLVVITEQNPVRNESLSFAGTAPFDAALIASLIAQAPELTALNVPTGQGNIEVGGHAMAGLEVRLSRGLSLNFDYRFTQVGSSSRLHSLGGALGIHW